MSRLTSRAPFNRPSAFDVLPPRPAPLSPPETDMESGPTPPQEEMMSSETQQFPTETPMARLRRVSTVAYTSSFSHRDHRPPQRQSRWLIVVVPPTSIAREPPVLGHTLSSAPAGRFSNGILMPLFPTLYGQLTAVAREFNMPSTAGVCIYLQLADGSASSLMTPRISDESWQLLWGHFFTGDERAAPLPPHGLPIAGRIEFDIDLRRARWFDSWMGNTRRERTESDIMSREPSIVPTHWRGDSRTSLFAMEQGEDTLSPPDGNPPATSLTSRTPTQRHLPRSLFLERRDTSARSFSRHPSRPPSISHDSASPEASKQTSGTPPIECTFVPKALSPVVMEQEEPQTAKKVDLDMIVRQWRQSSSVTGAPGTALAAAGQPSLDPVNMPPGAEVELDLDDFLWSISSVGPPSQSPSSARSSEPLPSVHLLGRLQGSVCLTPSTCTSFGPLDDWLDSPISCVSRRPSPDIGLRMMDFIPLTPSTATSWGPDDLPSPFFSEHEFDYRAPSVDVGVRGMGSRPMTPSTATGWGPSDSSSFMPLSPYYTRTPDAGERAFPDIELSHREARALVFPYYSAWETEPWRNVWPYQAHHRRESGNIVLATSIPPTQGEHLGLLPDFVALYRTDTNAERVAENKSRPVELPRSKRYPYFDLYPAVYPYSLDLIYPASQAHGSQVSDIREDRVTSKSPEWPDFAALYPADPRTERAAESKSRPVELPRPTGYPFFDLYPVVYPYNLREIYPSSSKAQTHIYNLRPVRGWGHVWPYRGSQDREAQSTVPFGHSPTQVKDVLLEWPDFTALYPANPKALRAVENKSQPVRLPAPSGYPFLEPYPMAYPYNLEKIYPVVHLSLESDVGVHREPEIQVHIRDTQYGLLPEWPDFASLYPSDPKAERAAANKSQPVTLRRNDGYPFVVPYEVVYPYYLQEIYPPSIGSLRSHVALRESPVKPKHRQLLPEESNFAGLYPPDEMEERNATNEARTVSLPAPGYPFLSVYTPVYPWNVAEIYAPAHSVGFIGESNKDISVQLPIYSGYPTFNLYPPLSGFPTFEIYPLVVLEPITTIPSVKLTPSYPAIELYEPVYPHLIIYPETHLNVTTEPLPLRSVSPRKRLPTPGPGRRRSLGIRSPISQEHEPDGLRRLSRSPVKKDLTPPLPVSFVPAMAVSADRGSTPWKAKRTHLELHRAVFRADSNPGLSVEPTDSRRPRRSHHDLHMMAFSDLLIEESQGSVDIVPELSFRRPPPVPIRRSRSGTVSQRSSLSPVAVQSSGSRYIADLPASGSGRPRRPSISTNANTSPPSDPLPPLPNKPSPLSLRMRSPSVSGLPARPNSVLNRVHSMNTTVRSNSTSSRALPVPPESRGLDLDRSRSLSDAQHVGASRQSIVLERAKMFTVSEKGTGISDVITDFPSPPSSRPVSKFDRSKLPFA